MRTAYKLFFLFLLVAGVSAQTHVNSSGSDVLVIEKNWRMEINTPTPLNYEDPFQANNDARQEQRDIKDNIRRNEVRTRAGLPLEAPPIRVKPMKADALPNHSSAVYFYEVKVKNNKEKKIQAITWEYVFFDDITKLEVGRLRFVSKVNISPGKTKNVVMRSASPPTGTVSVRQASKKTRDQYSEQIVIQSVDYVVDSEQ